ncbi:MAG: exopolyphosphatase [Denitrovibrio sp.]|nr:MAG: exopolyphosphatase [Denitrovibrio sp.]
MKVAAIDIGSNAVRLLIAEVEDRQITKIYQRKRHITKLAEVLNSKQVLSEASIERTMKALQDFVVIINEQMVQRVHAVATSAVREALNGQDLVDKAKELGIIIEIIDGDTEAGLIFDGVTSGIETKDKKVLVFDIGGGSTEFIYSDPDKGRKGISVPMGVVKMAEMYSFKDKLDLEHMDRMRIPLFSVMDQVIKTLDCEPEMLIGSAGTPTTLAAMDMEMTEYDQEKVNGYVLPIENIKKHFDKLAELPASERINIPGMEDGREEVIMPGILITGELMNMLGVYDMTVSDYGLREGLAIAIANV